MESFRPGEQSLSIRNRRQELEISLLQIERRHAARGALLRTWLEDHVLPSFGDSILAVDMPVARRSAVLHVPNPLPSRDSLIAATAPVHGTTLVTRNIILLNPWLP